MAKKKTNWDLVKDRGFDENYVGRDVQSSQNLERGSKTQKTSPIGRKIGAGFIGVGLFLFTLVASIAVLTIVSAIQPLLQGEAIGSTEALTSGEILGMWQVWLAALVIGGLGGLIAYDRFMASWRSENSMNDTTDINTHQNDQYIMLFEEMQRKFDYFPDAGAHSSVQVSSMLSHMMLSKKGLKQVPVTMRQKETRTELVVDDDGDSVEEMVYKGEPILDVDGNVVTKMMPIIDEKFGQELFTASGIPANEKGIRTPVNVSKIPYNPKNAEGYREDRDKLDYDTVGDLINNDWELPEYETQRPAGAYLVDTAPINTMVLAITRAGKGQTIIESTIDMWTREKRQNNVLINDPKGELLVKFYIPATIRGFEVVQFNLINAMKTDVYNPLGFAADAAREGDFTKASSYVTSISDIFFPVEGADDPMWPNAAGNAFKRSAYGLIDYYLEEEKELRREAERTGMDEKVLMQAIDDSWGKLSLFNAYQLFVLLSAKKSTDPNKIKIDEDDNVEEKDFLTLFFDATAKLPRNSMRGLVQNADNSLRAMAGSDKTIASVYGIALTAMSFFTDPTISTLTSGKPSQNFDAQGLSFPRRVGVRFGPEFLERYRMLGMQSVWSAYGDKQFTKRLLNDGAVEDETTGKVYLDDGSELDLEKHKKPKSDQFTHQQLVDRTGWARYFFDGKFKEKKAYLKLEIRNPSSDLLIRTFYFEIELTYKTSLNGRSYIKDPILNTKIIKDGVLREMHKIDDSHYVFRQTMVDRKYRDINKANPVEEVLKVPAFSQLTVKYSERPKMIFLITPPHLMSYAKLILILVKQMVDVNFESSYITKENQKPLYKTRYMLDELGNLQSEGHGIPALQTMLSIGLGQDQQFSCDALFCEKQNRLIFSGELL